MSTERLPWMITGVATVGAAAIAAWLGVNNARLAARVAELEARSAPASSASTRRTPERLERRVVKLQRRVVACETRRAVEREAAAASADHGVDAGAAPATEDEAVDAFAAAHARDAELFGEDELRKIEELYGQGNDAIETEAGVAQLDELIAEYPESNRAGCASMNLGTAYRNAEAYDEAERYLAPLIEKSHPGAFGDGSPVLPRALFEYGLVQRELGREDKANAAWERLTRDFPEAEDPGGRPFLEIVEREHARQPAPDAP